MPLPAGHLVDVLKMDNAPKLLGLLLTILQPRDAGGSGRRRGKGAAVADSRRRGRPPYRPSGVLLAALGAAERLMAAVRSGGLKVDGLAEGGKRLVEVVVALIHASSHDGVVSAAMGLLTELVQQSPGYTDQLLAAGGLEALLEAFGRLDSDDAVIDSLELLSALLQKRVDVMARAAELRHDVPGLLHFLRGRKNRSIDAAVGAILPKLATKSSAGLSLGPRAKGALPRISPTLK